MEKLCIIRKKSFIFIEKYIIEICLTYWIFCVREKSVLNVLKKVITETKVWRKKILPLK